MHRNSVSLCMIVRDAEETVGRAIKSALAIVDEVVVVDTGSMDNTRLIVEGYGARVVECAWNDDFAAARNAGLDAAYGDWILVLDADETLQSIRPVEVSRLVADDRAIAFTARVRQVGPDGTGSTCEEVRLFRNHPLARFRYPVHEQIRPALEELAAEQGRQFRTSRLEVRHPADQRAQAQSRRARNQRLLQRAIQEDPEQPWFRYQLARETAVEHDDRILPVKGFGATLQLLETAVRQVREAAACGASTPGFAAELYCLYASALLAADRAGEAVTVAEDVQRLCGDAPLARYAHARALIAAAALEADAGEAEAQLTIAFANLHQLLRGEVRRGSMPVSDRYFGPYPLVQLGHVALARDDREQARESFRAAMRACPEYTGALCGLARVARAEGRVHDALQIYLKVIAVDDRDVDAWIGGAETQIELGFADNARSWLGRLEQVMPEHPRLAALIAQLTDSARPAHAGG